MRRRAYPVLLIFFASAIGSAIAASCSATRAPNEFQDTSDSTGDTGAGGAGGAGGHGGASGTTSSTTGEGGGFILPDAGDDAPPDVAVNPCGSGCGPKELCDEDHLGFDDDCDGLVDEDCGCSTGQAHFCFKGDPSYYSSPGCFPGTEKCNEMGTWDPCLGGVHATENCFANDTKKCHPISATPFQNVDLKDGTGDFSLNALPGTEAWTVTCPMGVQPCPGVGGAAPPDDFKPLQSGEYSVTYTKGVQGGGTDMCTYPLFVGAPGLRVELQWEHDLGGEGVDLDLHVHQPQNPQQMIPLPWSVSGDPQDCTWSNCVFDDFNFANPSAPNWFSGGVMPPDPVNWYLDPVFEKNTCYFAPRGVGDDWQNLNKGCHNPRLDLDDITCNPSVVDVNDSDFCAPENVNIDFPPKDVWMRVSTHYYSSHGLEYAVHPTIKIFCDGALGAELGPTAYYDPESPITFESFDGAGDPEQNRWWLVADVAFKKTQCSSGCVVKPIYSDPATKTPFFTFAGAAESNFGPPYPPAP